MIRTRFSSTLAATGFALFSMAAFASSPTQPPAEQRPLAQPGTTSTTQFGQSEQLAEEDQDFLENAAQSGLAEVEGSRMALESEASAPVRAFAQKMIEAHTAANKELQDLASRKGFKLPDSPSVVQRTELLALQALSGGPFDSMYAARIGEAAHENAVELFEKATREAKDPDIRAFAEKMLPKLREHLEMARAMRKQVKAD